jgi:hypothetical protein
VNGQRFSPGKDFNVNQNNIPAKQAFSEVVLIGTNVPVDSIKPFSLSGKLVIVAGEKRMLRTGRRALPRLEAIKNSNPAAIIYIDLEYTDGSSMMLSSFKKNIIPQQFTITENLAKSIIGNNYQNAITLVTPTVYQSNILLHVEKMTKKLQSSNVIGILPGTDLKDEYLFITAHYDHLGKRDTVIYYGADDDGSGTVAVIEIAEAYAKAKAAGHGPRRTIVFMTVSGEEKGLLGSEYYCNYPLYPLNKTTADLNIDMIGRIDPDKKTGDSTNYIYVVGNDKVSSELKPISEMQNKKFTKLEYDYKYNDPADKEQIFYRSDHYNFAKKGVPVIFYYDGMLRPDYHKPTDTPDKINYSLMAKRAQLVFYTSWEMANRDNMIKRDIALPVFER